jgi:hypothetical protein
MITQFSGRICQLNPGAKLWTLDWIAEVMLQDLLSENAGWQVQTPVKVLPFDHPAYGFRADNKLVKLFGQADEEGMREFQGQPSYNVIVQAKFVYESGMSNTLIPGALEAMQATVAAASKNQFWIPF